MDSNTVEDLIFSIIAQPDEIKGSPFWFLTLCHFFREVLFHRFGYFDAFSSEKAFFESEGSAFGFFDMVQFLGTIFVGKETFHCWFL